MNKIEEIKKRNERRKELMKDRTDEYNLTREIEYSALVEKSVEDTAYLLSIIEQAEKNLEQINLYLEAEAYTNAWKETIKALKSIQGEE